jgi:hypothetical protein
MIVAELGGAPGYQHGIEHSKFSVGAGPRYVNELGFLKVVGSQGVFAVDAANGLVVAIANAGAGLEAQKPWFTQSSDRHNQLVLNYFVAAGIAKDQVSAVRATTSLASGGNDKQAHALPSMVVGYQSILDRKVGDLPVIDSVAWARLNDRGVVLAEWVYWPAISARVIAEATQMRETIANDASRGAFLARLPADLPSGSVVIRHSAATSTRPFVSFASYDVQERRPVLSPDGRPRPTDGRAVVIARHFGADGREFRLPQEEHGLAEDYPTAKRPPPTRNAR